MQTTGAPCPIFLLALFLSCGSGLGACGCGDDDTGPDGDGDGDSDADADADGDGGADADGDADAGPRQELCNGMDDDGDGRIDEDDPESGLFCRTDEPGECSGGHTVCEAGRRVCVAENQPVTEGCHNAGRDDDCNGRVDDIQYLGEPCDTGLPGVCALGTAACDGADLVCIQSLDATAPCDTGLEGICGPGTERCVDDLPVCESDLPPSPELCPNGLDDDCNGIVDDGHVAEPESCANPGFDDDCNGIRDDVPERNQPCDTGLLGPCATGTTRCANPDLVCIPDARPTLEDCGNRVDDDCDGETDEVDCMDSCAELAAQLCEERGWVVVDDPADGNLVCTSDGRGDWRHCSTCETYNIYAWEDGSSERHCPGRYSTVAGGIYSAHTPCECGDNLDLCDTWDVSDCIPD